MTIRSRWSLEIPKVSLQDWIFGSSRGPIDAGDTKMFVDADRPDTHYLTMYDYRLLAKRVAVGLLDRGLQKGDRVLVFSSNSIYFPSILMGILMAGGIFTGANPSYVARELAYQLKDSGARFLISAAGSLSVAIDAAGQVGIPPSDMYVLDDFENSPGGVARTNAPTKPIMPAGAAAAGIHHWLELVDHNMARAEAWDWDPVPDPETTVSCLNYSSGTTGVPKGVQLSHGNYVANCTGVEFMDTLDPDREKKTRIGLCFLPMYHAYGQTYFVANLPKVRTTSYFMARFDFEKMLQHIQRFRVSYLSVVPPIAVALSKHPLTKKYDLSSVNTVGCGAAPLSPEVAVALKKLWPPEKAVKVRQGWGMTELTCTSMNWDPRATHETPGAVGELAANCAARLVDVSDEATSSPHTGGTIPYITEAGKAGELWVTGPTLMMGYWGRPEATRDTMYVDAETGERWLKTGDIAYVDNYEVGGHFHIVERRKELIKVKGNQVAPAELEALLLERPDVVDAAVIGVQVDGEERPRAYIVRVPGTAATGDEIAAWLAGHVAPFKRLVGGVVFTDEIPKNPSGKILRKILRDQAAREATSKL